MPPKVNDKDYLIMVVNLGSTDEKEGENEKSFLDKSKIIMRRLIQRQIFIRPKDEVGIITIGASGSKNQLSYDNIVEMNRLKIASWDLVESVIKLKGTKEKGNWVDGISVARDYINRECLEKGATTTVALLNDFKEDPDVIYQYDVKVIAKEIKDAGIRLLPIGNRSLTVATQTELNPSEKLFQEVCQMVDADMMTFDETIPKLMIYKDKPKKSMPWKVDMDLFDIEIPVILYLKTTEDFQQPRLQLFTEDTQGNAGRENVPVGKTRALVDKDKKIINPEDVITGVMYGRKFIPLSDEDKVAQKYQSGPKGFNIFGFTEKTNITMDRLSGKASYIVVPVKGYASPFYSLVKAMADKEKVAIVRRVHRQNVAPKIGVLFPKLGDTCGQPWCLVYIELTFAEDRRIVRKNSLKSTARKILDDQKAAVDNLIETMMLTEVEDDSTKEKCEPFAPGTVPNVSRQHVFDMFTHRALKPNAPLPPMLDYLKKLLEPPKSVQEKSAAALKEIEKLFDIQLVERKKDKDKRNIQSAKNVEKSISDTQNTSVSEVSEDSMGLEDSNALKFEPDDEAEEDELCQVVDAASAAIDIDFDELADDM